MPIVLDTSIYYDKNNNDLQRFQEIKTDKTNNIAYKRRSKEVINNKNQNKIKCMARLVSINYSNN